AGESLDPANRLQTAAQHGQRLDGFRQQDDFVGVTEGDRAVAHRHVVALDHEPGREMVLTLQSPGDAHVDGTADTPIDPQDFVRIRVYPDAPSRRDRTRPVEAVVVAAFV